MFGSNETPQEITDRYVDPPAGERTLVASEDGNSGTVFLVRNDGTAHAMIGLTFLSRLRMAPGDVQYVSRSPLQDSGEMSGRGPRFESCQG